MEPPPASNIRMEAAAPTPTPPVTSLPIDPSSHQYHQQSSSNPNPNFSQPPNNVPFNMQPAWVGSPPLPSGIAIGVPANSSQPAANTAVYSSPIPRNIDSLPSPTMPSMSSSMGMIGSHLRPGGIPQHISVVGPPRSTSNIQSTISQNFQGHGTLRAPSVALPSTSAPSTSQSQLSSRQPWLSTQHGRPPMPSLRPQVTSQTSQQRTHIPQQSSQPMPATSQQQQSLSFSQQQQHFPASIHSQDSSGQQLSSSKNSQLLINQQQISRVQALGNQRPPSPVIGQASIMHSGPTDNIGRAEAIESCTRVLSKRSIQELVNQVDPLEKLDPEVEDVLVDIADDFIDSVATFGCSLAKHRKSNMLEAKDILLHLERTWNMTLPGFSGDEIKTYKKPVGNDIHKERMAVIKKSYWS